MPELPEVEVTRRRISPLLCGREIAAVTARPASSFFLTPPATLRRRLLGRRVVALDRRGKYLLGELDDGSRLLLHLGMTGQLVAASAESPRLYRLRDRHAGASATPGSASDEHVHLRLGFRDRGEEIRFRDPRRFGRVQWLAAEAACPRLERLGPDALEATAAALRGALARRRAPIKALLLDQSLLAGVGNIYADEALFAAGLRPLRPGGALSPHAVATLLAALQRILCASIAQGGTSISDFVAPDGSDGAYVNELGVYGREGLPCTACGATIRRIVIAGRSSHYCPRCQR